MTPLTRDDTLYGVEYVTKHEAQMEIDAAYHRGKTDALASATPSLRWSHQLPASPGWYWTRWHGGDLGIIHVTEWKGSLWCGGSNIAKIATREWAGPLELPAEKNGKEVAP